MTTAAHASYAEAGGGFVPSIQGLRGVAAMSVLIDHFCDMPKAGVYDLPNPGFLPPIWPWLQSVINSGGHGVELFFMISGFLIPASLVRHGSIGKFMYDRMLRIMPVFLMLHLVLFAAGPIVGYKFFQGIDLPTYLRVFFANLFFIQDALGLPIAQQNAWTLTYEWAFYILFALSFGAIVRLKSWPLAAPLVLLGCLCLLRWPITAFFIVGMLFSAINLRFRIRGAAGVAVGLACFAGMYVALEVLYPFAALIPGFLLFGMVLAAGSGMATLLSLAPLQYLGKISYSLYLVHPFVLFPLQMVGLKLVDRGVDRWLLWSGFVIFGLLLALVASALSYEIVEVRVRRLIDTMLRRTFARKMAQSPAA